MLHVEFGSDGYFFSQLLNKRNPEYKGVQKFAEAPVDYGHLSEARPPRKRKAIG